MVMGEIRKWDSPGWGAYGYPAPTGEARYEDQNPHSRAVSVFERHDKATAALKEAARTGDNVAKAAAQAEYAEARREYDAVTDATNLDRRISLGDLYDQAEVNVQAAEDEYEAGL